MMLSTSKKGLSALTIVATAIVLSACDTSSSNSGTVPRSQTPMSVDALSSAASFLGAASGKEQTHHH